MAASAPAPQVRSLGVGGREDGEDSTAHHCSSVVTDRPHEMLFTEGHPHIQLIPSSWLTGAGVQGGSKVIL